MKIAIISDIHSNLQALEATLEAIDKEVVEEVYCLGDVVGYGADPAACVDLVMEHCTGVVLGNHDDAVAAERGLKVLPKDARAAARHNRERLSDAQIAFLTELPLTLEAHGCTFVHAAPQAPSSWLRLDSFVRVKDQFDHFQTDLCFVGHTHVPGVVSDKIGVLTVRPGHRYLVNTGSVGQPRDEDPRASFAVFDTTEISCEFIRVGYDVATAAERIKEDGLPNGLAERLFRGR